MTKNDLQPHPSWEIVDSSKLKVYQRCGRAFLFEYGFGWRLEGPDNNLIFGEAWHRSQRHLLVNGYSVESVMEAAKVGEEYIRRYFPPGMDAVNEPKIPGILPVALAEYVATYKSDRFEVLHTEVGDRVPIDDKRVLYFRMDAIVRDMNRNGLIVGLEHKTSKRRGYFEQYTTDIANGTYSHVLYSAFDPKDIYGLVVSGAVFLKKERDFQRLPARRQSESMMEWLWTVQHLYDRLEWDFAELDECSEDDTVMTAFVKQTEDCFKYGRCRYYDLCHAWTNPLQHAEFPPPGFKVEWWDPREREKKATFNPDGTITPIEEEKNETEMVEAPNYTIQTLSPLERARAKVAESGISKAT